MLKTLGLIIIPFFTLVSGEYLALIGGGNCFIPPSAQTRITFYSNRDGDMDIYIMNPDGTNVVKLTDNDTPDNGPSLSPDGKKIAFSSRRDGDSEIFVMNAERSGVVQLTNNSASDEGSSWSPNGQKIAFGSDRDGDDEIYVMNADGSNVVKLTNNDVSDLTPHWGIIDEGYIP